MDAMRGDLEDMRAAERQGPAILELAALIAGGEEAYRDHPFLTHFHCPMIAPLKMDNDSTAQMIYFTEQGLTTPPSCRTPA